MNRRAVTAVLNDKGKLCLFGTPPVAVQLQVYDESKYEEGEDSQPGSKIHTADQKVARRRRKICHCHCLVLLVRLAMVLCPNLWRLVGDGNDGKVVIISSLIIFCVVLVEDVILLLEVIQQLIIFIIVVVARCPVPIFVIVII